MSVTLFKCRILIPLILFLFGLLPFSAISAQLQAPVPTGASGEYSQLVVGRSQLNLTNVNITLTGGTDGQLTTSTATKPGIIYLSAVNANSTLTLQPGTFSGELILRGDRTNSVYNARVFIGKQNAGGRVILTGDISGGTDPVNFAKPGAIIQNVIQTNGAELLVQGTLGNGRGNALGELRAWNGNVIINSSKSSQIYRISTRNNMNIDASSGQQIVLGALDIQGSSRVISNGLHFYNQINGGISDSASLHSDSDIWFLDSWSPGQGGLVNGSGTFSATNDISASSHNSNYNYPITQAANGHLTLRSDNGNIAASVINAENISAAKGQIVAGEPPVNNEILALRAGDGVFTPSGAITTSNIATKKISAGEFTLKAAGSTPGSLTAENLLVVKNPSANGHESSGDLVINSGSFTFTGKEAVGEAGYDDSGSIFQKDETSYVGGNMTVSGNGKSSFTSLGVGGAASISGGSLEGDLLNAASLELKNGVKAKITEVNASDAVSIAAGTYEGTNINAVSAELKNGVSTNIANLKLTDTASGAISIGSADDTGITRASIENLTLNSRPLQVGAGAGSAQSAIANFKINDNAGNISDGDIYVGHNGILALGTTDVNWLPALAAGAGMPANAAVLGIYSSLILGNGLHVDTGWSQPSNRSRIMGRATGGIDFSPNSLLVIDGGAPGVAYANPSVPTMALPADTPGAISAEAPATANVAGGARIFIDHVTPGHTYVALGKNISTRYADDTAWSGANLLSSNPLLGLTRLGNGKEGQFGVEEKAPHTTRLTTTSAVPRMARAASEAMESAIYHRIRLGHEDLHRRNFALWALPLYEHINEFGMDGGSSSYGYEGGIGGVAIGGDYTWEDTFRLGAAFHIGGGYARSTGESATTKNNLDFWGVGAYGVWKPGAFSLDADIDFTSTYNKLKQDLPTGLPAPQIKADIPAWALGMSLRAQYEFDTDWLIIRPHFGVRYFHLDTSPYDATINGQDVLRAHRSYQNVWTFPIGIVFTKNFQFGNGYELTPLINLKAIPASGDTYVKNSVRYAGASRDLDMDTQVMDDITWGGRAGIEFRAGDFNVGINYTAQFGRHTSNQGVFGVLRYEF